MPKNAPRIDRDVTNFIEFLQETADDSDEPPQQLSRDAGIHEGVSRRTCAQVGLVLRGNSIVDIVHGSSAFLNGCVETGDEIVAVDGIDVSELDKSVHKHLCGTVGTVVYLTVRRNRTHPAQFIDFSLMRHAGGYCHEEKRRLTGSLSGKKIRMPKGSRKHSKGSVSSDDNDNRTSVTMDPLSPVSPHLVSPAAFDPQGHGPKGRGSGNHGAAGGHPQGHRMAQSQGHTMAQSQSHTMAQSQSHTMAQSQSHTMAQSQGHAGAHPVTGGLVSGHSSSGVHVKPSSAITQTQVLPSNAFSNMSLSGSRASTSQSVPSAAPGMGGMTPSAMIFPIQTPQAVRLDHWPSFEERLHERKQDHTPSPLIRRGSFDESQSSQLSQIPMRLSETMQPGAASPHTVKVDNAGMSTPVAPITNPHGSRPFSFQLPPKPPMMHGASTPSPLQWGGR